jgi:succinate dehydrogenase hydrophobic anchor subunit
MARSHYDPPRQGIFGQVVDVIVLLILTIGALYVPLYLGLAGAAKVPQPIENPTWEALDQNPVEQQQWAALGITDPAAANEIVTARFDYSFSWAALVVMAVLVIGYFVLVVRLSEREYREVIDERFGPRR